MIPASAGRPALSRRNMTRPDPFKGIRSGPEIIRPAAMLHMRFHLSLRNVGDVLCERGGDISPETVRHWRHRFGALFTAEFRKRRDTHLVACL